LYNKKFARYIFLCQVFTAGSCLFVRTFGTVSPRDLLDDSTPAALSDYGWNMYWGKNTFMS